MRKLLKPVYDCVVRDEEGATMVEYGLMVSLIAVVCIVAVRLIGTNLDVMFDSVGAEINTTP